MFEVAAVEATIPFCATNWREHRSGALLGFADIEVPSINMTFCGCPAFEKSGRRWLTMPSKTFRKSDGKNGYELIVKITDRSKADWFSRMAIAALVAEGFLR